MRSMLKSSKPRTLQPLELIWTSVENSFPRKWSLLCYAMRYYAENFVRNLIMQSMSEMQRDEPPVLDSITPDVSQGRHLEQARQGTRLP